MTAAGEAMAVAEAIGDRMAAEAIWLADRCNWIGAEPLDLRTGDRWGLTYRALGPTVYSGTAGVALYLAQLSAVSGRAELGRTAAGAMRHAISRADEVAPPARLGFYAGWSGIAAAALRVGLLLGSAEFLEAGRTQLRAVGRLIESPLPDGPEYDLMAGVAGAVPALALGYRCTGDEAMLRWAARAARWLVGAARATGTGWSWCSPGLRNQHDLTGLSHGAAGAAVAFIEAYRLTGEEEFATGARRAMWYEDGWLDTEQGNWPDFRENPMDRRARSYATLWCHGSPGIALSRAFAHRHLGDPQWRDDAGLALATTHRVTRRLADGGEADFSLCHGLAGNAEAVVEAGRMLGGAAVDTDLPAVVAEHGLERYARTGVAWPCGTHSAETPNLMLGLAGIGHFYLRLACPQVPSVLLPTGWHELDDHDE